MHFTEWPFAPFWLALWAVWLWSTRYVGRGPYSPGHPCVNAFWGAMSLIGSLMLFVIGGAIGAPMAKEQGVTMWLGVVILLGHIIPGLISWNLALGVELWWSVCAHDSPRWLRRWFYEH